MNCWKLEHTESNDTKHPQVETSIMTKLIVLSLLFVSIADCFVPNFKTSVTKKNRVITSLHYFDDVSRKITTSPSPSSAQLDRLFQNVTFASTGFRPTTRTNILTSDYHQDKLETLQKTLFGHDFQSALLLKTQDIDKIMNAWIEKVDFCSDFLQATSEDVEILIDINESSSLIGCYERLWDRINSISFDPSQVSNKMELILFPYCRELYKYDNMARIMKDFKVCEENCSILGKELSLSAFHPLFDNEPRMFHATRHSPFPCFGIQIPITNAQARRELSDRNDWKNISQPKKGSQDDNQEIDAMFSDYMEQTRSELENLFQSAAVTSKSDTMGESLGSNDNEPFLSSEQVTDDKYFVELMKDWIREQQTSKDDGGEVNHTLQYIGTIGDRWIVSSTTLEETLYSEVWTIVNERIQANEISPSLNSVMFLAPNFAMYNAQKFKRFAVSINRTLKTSADGKAFIGELFHPEFVGANDKQSKLRRSPFSALLVVFP